MREERACEAGLVKEAARRNSLSVAAAARLLNDESPMRVWRSKRGLTQRALAAPADVAPNYLADMENGRDPDRNGALSRLAWALDVLLDEMVI